jgi:hypothetical protein
MDAAQTACLRSGKMKRSFITKAKTHGARKSMRNKTGRTIRTDYAASVGV